MFGFFKRTRIESWETDIMLEVLYQLPNEYHIYISQIKNGLFKGVLIGLSDINGYVGFSYNSKVYNEFYNQEGRNFKLSNIKIYDTISDNFLQYSIFFSYGVINGYSVENSKKYKFDSKKVDILNVEKCFLDSVDYLKLSKILTASELALINPSDVYIIVLQKKEYFHIREIGDGDFFGMDFNKKVYKITHDPFIIKMIDVSMEELFEL